MEVIEVLGWASIVMLCLIGFKSVWGIRFPWERIVRAKESLLADLASVGNLIPNDTYKRMEKSILDI